ncbi:hypothetical protein BDV97DRAFT_356968 [Delphinella strobiligena]|nr:hypothetical protein BDV97DRAFT_356968 [Delphinella strobiligena]
MSGCSIGRAMSSVLCVLVFYFLRALQRLLLFCFREALEALREWLVCNFWITEYVIFVFDVVA